MNEGKLKIWNEYFRLFVCGGNREMVSKCLKDLLLLLISEKEKALESQPMSLSVQKEYKEFINLQDSNGKTALMIAIEAGQMEMVELLMKEGADINLCDSKGKTALMAAVEAGQIEMAELLMKEGADINLCDSKGKTALMAAVEAGQIDMAEFLIKKGADITMKDTSGRTALDYVEKADEQNSKKMLTMLSEEKEKQEDEKALAKLLEMTPKAGDVKQIAREMLVCILRFTERTKNEALTEEQIMFLNKIQKELKGKSFFERFLSNTVLRKKWVDYVNKLNVILKKLKSKETWLERFVAEELEVVEVVSQGFAENKASKAAKVAIKGEKRRVVSVAKPRAIGHIRRASVMDKIGDCLTHSRTFSSSSRVM